MDEVHFNHYLPYSDNSPYDIVLNVQLPPASIERITIIVSTDDFQSLPKESPVNGVIGLAISDATFLAETDIAECDPASDPDLEKIAGFLTCGYIRRPDILQAIQGLDISEIIKMSNSTFTSKYREITESSGMIHLSKLEESIRLRAYTDKEQDMKEGHFLSELELTCRAAIGEHQHADADLRSQDHYFSEVAKRVASYLSYYNQPNLEEKLEGNIKWEDRLRRAYLFREQPMQP
jgi:hypothetical protein